MRLFRRSLLAMALATPAVAQPAWPTRTVRIIVPYPPGGGTDALARLMAQHLQARLGQAFVVENRAGGAGVVGTEQVARAAPDGYTLAVNASGPITVLPHLQAVNYDPLGGFAPVCLPAMTPLLLVVPPNSPLRSVEDLLQRARAEPGRMNLCNIGIGSPSQLVAEMFVRAFGLDLAHVPYRGSAPALQDVAAGHCELLFDSGTSSMPLVRQGVVRALAATAPRRIAALPEVPTLVEKGARDFEASTWSGLFAPAGTPEPIVALLNRELRAFMAEPAQQARFAELGSVPLDYAPAEFSAFLARESAAWGRVIREANIRL